MYTGIQVNGSMCYSTATGIIQMMHVSESDIQTMMDPRLKMSHDNGEYHVTAFRPISDAAHSWSYDKTF